MIYLSQNMLDHIRKSWATVEKKDIKDTKVAIWIDRGGRVWNSLPIEGDIDIFRLEETDRILKSTEIEIK